MSTKPDVVTPVELWNSLRSRAEPVTMTMLAPHMRLSTTNSATRPAAAAQSAGAETTVQEYPLPRTQNAADPDQFFDSFALLQRVDVVNEDVLPFVPFVQPLSLRQFQLIEYGMLLSAEERTLLLLHQFVPPIEKRVRHGTSALTVGHYGVDIKHSVPTRALLPGEMEGNEDEDCPTRARFGAESNSDCNDKERVYHAFLMRIAEDSRDGSATVVPEFRLTFVNRGTDNSHLGASFVCTGCYASANKYFDVHSDLRVQRDFYTSLPYYSRFTADRFEPLRHREELFALWKRLTGGSILADGKPRPQVGEEQGGGAAPVCGYAVEDYQIQEELKMAARRGDEDASDNLKSVAARTVYSVATAATTKSISSSVSGNNKALKGATGATTAAAAAAVDGIERYLKSVDVSGSASRMHDHSVVDDPDVCDAVAVMAGAIPIPEVRPTSTGDFIVRRCTYQHDRMAQRVLVEERRRGPAWRTHWEAMCAHLGLSDDFTKLKDGRVSAARVVMRDTRSGENVLEDGEITAYIPSDAEASLRTVHSDEAEEQLRLWVTKALITCEAYGVHLALLPIDTDMLLSRCIGLLFDNDGGLQRREDEELHPSADLDHMEKERARRRILRIVVEAAEDFVQFSGVLWRAVLYLDGRSNTTKSAQLAAGGERTLLDDLREVSDYAIGRGMLSQIRSRKLQAEHDATVGAVPRPATGSRPVTSSQTNAVMDVSSHHGRTPKELRARFGTDPRLSATSPLRQIRPQVVAAVTMVPAVTESPARVREGHGSSIVSHSLVTAGSYQVSPYEEAAVTPARSKGLQSDGGALSARSAEVKSSTLYGLYLDENSQLELFNRIDVNRSGTVSLKELLNVLLKKTTRYDKQVLTSRGTIAGRAVHESSYSSGNVLSPIDNCGVPLDEKHLEQFLARHARKHNDAMEFPEFQVMLLEMARR